MDLSLVIPFYNEEKCVREVLVDTLKILKDAQINHELIAINNGSWDKTETIIEELQKTHPELGLLSFKENQGFGGAIIKALKKSRGRIIGFTCGDGEVKADVTPVLYRLLNEKNIHIAKAKRTHRKDGFQRKLFTLGFHSVVMALFQPAIGDVNGYPVLMRREVFEQLGLKETNWMITVEIIVRARKNRFTIVELDSEHQERLGGFSHVRPHFPFMFLNQLFRFWLNERKNT